MNAKPAWLWLCPSQACPQRAGNECQHRLALLTCKGDAAKSHWFAYCRVWGMDRDVQVSFSLGYLDLSDSCTSSSWRVLYRSTKRTSWKFLWLYLCMIYNTQSLKRRHNRRHPERWALVVPWQGPEVFVMVPWGCRWRQERLKQKILYVQSAALKFATFGNLQYPSLSSVPTPELVTGARLAQRRVLGLRQKCEHSPERRSHASWCAEPHPPRAH